MPWFYTILLTVIAELLPALVFKVSASFARFDFVKTTTSSVVDTRYGILLQNEGRTAVETHFP